jgi:hypothetical protein
LQRDLPGKLGGVRLGKERRHRTPGLDDRPLFFLESFDRHGTTHLTSAGAFRSIVR